MSRQSGWLAQRQGQSWEDALNLYHEFLAGQGLAIVNKTGPEVKFVKMRGKVGPVVVAPGVADYVGVLRTGTFVAFEAKSTGDTSGYSIPKRSLHQLLWLSAIDELVGSWARVFYVVRYRKLDETRLHRIRDIRPGSRIRQPQGVLVPDGISWLDVINDM